MKYSFVPWIALGISLAVTTIVWGTILDLDRQSQELEFNSLTEKSAAQIEDQLKTHEQVLMGFQGLFLASYEVEPAEFTTFFNSQKIPDRFPDTQGVGYNEYVFGENEKNELVKRLAGYGLDYAINPEGTRSTYVPVVYLEPQDVMNKRALGYDIYSEEIRKQAIDQAIKTGKTTLTGKIILVQETSKDVQNGFLMLLPVYQYDEKTCSA
jgi:CHASE1-domain containing sensor protein